MAKAKHGQVKSETDAQRRARVASLQRARLGLPEQTRRRARTSNPAGQPTVTLAADPPIPRKDLEPGFPGMASGATTYKVGDNGLIARPEYSTAEVNAAIDAAIDYNPDASHAAWVAKRIALHDWTLEVTVPGPDGEPVKDDALTADALLFARRIFTSYGGGIDAMLDVGLDCLLRRGAIAAELDIADGRDDVMDVDLVPPERVDFQVVRKGKHRRIIPVYLPDGYGDPKPFNAFTFAYLGINASVGRPHGQSPYLAIVDTTFPQAELRNTTQAVLKNQGFARISLVIDYEAAAKSLGEKIVRVGQDGSFTILDYKAFTREMNAYRADVTRQAKAMYADDVWVTFSQVKAGSIGADHAGKSLSAKQLAELFDTDQIVALHGQPTLHGRSYGAALSTTGDVQWIVTALGYEALREYPARFVEWVFNQRYRIRGIQATANVVFPQIRREDRKAEAEARKIEIEADLILLNAGAMDLDEFSQKHTGHDAPEPAKGAPTPAPGGGKNTAPATDPALEADDPPPPPKPTNGHKKHAAAHDAACICRECADILFQGEGSDLAADPFVPADPRAAGEIELVGGEVLDGEDLKRAMRAWAKWAEEAAPTWAGIVDAVNVGGNEPNQNGLAYTLAPASEWKSDRSDRWQWDPGAARFRYPPGKDRTLGKLVPPARVARLFERKLEDHRSVVRDVTEKLTRGDITLSQWQKRVKASLADVHLQAHVLGAGGRDEMDRRAFELAGERWRTDVRRLASWSQQIAQGQAGTAAQINARAEVMFGKATVRETYEGARLEATLTAGFQEERWERGASDSCEGCLFQEALGWVPLGTLPPIGSNQCRANCGCGKSQRYSAERELPPRLVHASDDRLELEAA